MTRTTEDQFTAPSGWQPHPEWWHADTADAAEWEVTGLVAAFTRALQPGIVVETGTNTGQTARAVGYALRINGHGHLYTLESDPALAGAAEQSCAGLPVTVICGDSLTWEPPGPVGLAWLDSGLGIRAAELERLAPHLEDGAVVGVHDTGPQHPVAALLAAAGWFRAITLRTPRGVTFGQVTR